MSNPTGYKSGVESVADNIAMDIIQRGTSTSNGSELANMYCSKIEGGCNSQELSELNRTINDLPIYLIIAHSNIDLKFKIQNDNFLLKNGSTLFKTLDVSSDLSNSKFIINTTTTGGWGLLDEKTSCVPIGHLLRRDGIALRNFLFDPNINCEERISVWSTKEDHVRRDLERKDSRYPPLFNIPGSKFIDKPHQFGGSKLSGGGFGIIKMTKPSGTKAIDAISKWEKIHLKGADAVFEENVYFLSDNGGDLGKGMHRDFTDKDQALYDLLRDSWSIDKYIDHDSETGTVDMGASNVTLNQIITTGGPGVYISLSCSEYFTEFPSPKEEIDYTANSPDLILTSRIDQAFQTVGAVNRDQWDTFIKTLNYAIKRSRGKADYAPEASTLIESGKMGPGYVDRMSAIKDLPASTAKLRQQQSSTKQKKKGGKRKTRKRKKKKTRRKSIKRSRRKRKTRRKKYKGKTNSRKK